MYSYDLLFKYGKVKNTGLSIYALIFSFINVSNFLSL
jgi:hypothetical protein